jgi:hypothetical protein
MATTSASGFCCEQHQLQLTCNRSKATAIAITIQNPDLEKCQFIQLESLNIYVLLLHERGITTRVKNN